MSRPDVHNAHKLKQMDRPPEMNGDSIMGALDAAQQRAGLRNYGFNREEDKRTFLKDLFMKFDIDGKGRLSVEELQFILETIGIRLSAAAVNQLFVEMDTDASGFIDLDEFYNVFGSLEHLDEFRADLRSSQFRQRVKSIIVGSSTMINLLFVFILLYLYVQERVEPYRTLLIINSIISVMLLFVVVVYPLTMGKCYQYQIPQKFKRWLARVRESMVGAEQIPHMNYTMRTAPVEASRTQREFSYRKRNMLEETQDDVEQHLPLPGLVSFSDMRDAYNEEEEEEPHRQASAYEKNAYLAAEEAQTMRDDYVSFQPMCNGHVSDTSGQEWMSRSFTVSFNNQLQIALEEEPVLALTN